MKNFSTTEKRIELKDVFKTRDRLLLDRAIAFSRFSFTKSYPDRVVNSIYFDTFDCKSLEESLEGGSVRKKSRIRWYGTQKDESNATLEIKLKQGYLSWKKLCKDAFTISPTARKWNQFLHSNLDNSISNYYLHNLIPQSIITYQRSYFASFDGKVRLTIDHNLKTYAQNNFFNRNFECKRLLNDILVLEVKVSRQNQSLLPHVLKDLPFNTRRFSKYCESIIPQKYF